MSKKIFVFEDEDWEKLKHRESDSAGLSSWELMYEFKAHELDVIGFEAVAIEYSPPSEGYLRALLLDPLKLPKDKFKNNNKLQVFVCQAQETGGER